MKTVMQIIGILCLWWFQGATCYSQVNPNPDQILASKAQYDSAVLAYENYEIKHGGFVQTKNVNLHYLEWGDPQGTPLIWAHGSFTNGYELLDVAGDLVNSGYFVIAIDYYGHGLTVIPRHDVSLYHVADDINTLMEKKRIDKAVIGGWSRGGAIASAFYDTYPDKVLGLILEDGGSVSFNSHYHKMEERDLNNRVKEIFKDKVAYPVFDSQFEAYQSFYNYDRKGTQFELLAWLTEAPNGKWSLGIGIENLFSMANEAQFMNTVLRPTRATLFGESMAIIEPRIIYRNLNVPMLILDPVSNQDIFPFQEENARLQKQHEHLVIHKIYENTGHNIHYERPNQFISDVGEFLTVVKRHWSKKIEPIKQ